MTETITAWKSPLKRTRSRQESLAKQGSGLICRMHKDAQLQMPSLASVRESGPYLSNPTTVGPIGCPLPVRTLATFSGLYSCVAPCRTAVHPVRRFVRQRVHHLMIPVLQLWAGRSSSMPVRTGR